MARLNRDTYPAARVDSDPFRQAELAIHLLGQMEVLVSGSIVARLPTRRAGWLLAILVLRKGQPIERRSLAGLLWPDSSDAGALHNLRQTLAGLRHTLGPAGRLIATVSPRSIFLQPTPAVWADVFEYDTASTDGSLAALERALNFYRGPLLAGCHEPFAVEERDLRERSFTSIVERLAARYAALQDHSRATDMLRRAVAADPYRESAFRALMTSLAASGEAAAAMDLYRNLRLNLRRELNAEPDPETKGLYRSIRNGLTTRVPGKGFSATCEQRIPTPLSTFLGRKSEVREIASLVERCRLITLTGVGGVGKTRLAIAVAAAIGDNYLDGAWFVDLAPLRDPATVPSAIAASLDIQEQAGRPLIETLAERLRGRDLIIVLDNCEHLTQGVAGALEVLLSASPGLHVLATSRQSVGVGGELVWRVCPLPTPEAISPSARNAMGSADRAGHLMQSDSVRLFVDRSNQAGSVGTPSASELEAIGSICRRLDGIPLAIELAAARTKVLSVTEIEARLEDRFTLLAGGSRSLARHETLRAAIDWSWDLLTAAERALLMRLCVFRGGCTLEAAEAVSPGDGDTPSVLELIANLVDRSLVSSTRATDGSRFSMLESIRQFTAERLRETEEWERTFDRHRDFFLRLAEEAELNLEGPEEAVWFSRLETEHDNLRAALDWSQSRRHVETALKLAVALGRFWDTHGHLREGRALLEASLERASVHFPPALLAKGHLHAGWMATVQRDLGAAQDHYEQALPLFRKIGDERNTATVLNCLATATYYSGDCPSAQAQYEESLAIFRGIGRQGGVATVLNNLGELALHLEDCDAARSYLEQSIAEGGGLHCGIPERRGLTLCNLSLADLRQGRCEEARAHAVYALKLFRDAALVVSIPGALNQIALVVASFEEWERAARLFGASEGLAAVQGVPLANLLAREREEAMATACSAVGLASFRSAFEAGQQMTMDESIAYALTGERAS